MGEMGRKSGWEIQPQQSGQLSRRPLLLLLGLLRAHAPATLPPDITIGQGECEAAAPVEEKDKTKQRPVLPSIVVVLLEFMEAENQPERRERAGAHNGPDVLRGEELELRPTTCVAGAIVAGDTRNHWQVVQP